MPTFRTLRCANAQLYIAATLIVLAAAAYVLCTKDPLWQQITAILAAIITPIWTAYYAFLRITVDTTGVTRRSLTGSTRITWQEHPTATLHETNNQAVTSCTITLQSGQRSIRISSDVFPLDSVQELARELAECKLLP